MTAIFTKLLLLIAAIDPIGSDPVYLEATKQFDKKHKVKVAIHASFPLTTLLVLVVIVLTCLLLITVISKIMGFILASSAVESILSGLWDFFWYLD